MGAAETCTEFDGSSVCGQPVADEVSWEMRPDGTRGGVTNRVCGDCADDLMGWRASHLSPTRRPIGGAR